MLSKNNNKKRKQEGKRAGFSLCLLSITRVRLKVIHVHSGGKLINKINWLLISTIDIYFTLCGKWTGSYTALLILFYHPFD